MTGAGTGAPKRETYRHGNLRRALVAAGVEMARRGGPGAVVLREATRGRVTVAVTGRNPNLRCMGSVGERQTLAHV